MRDQVRRSSWTRTMNREYEVKPKFEVRTGIIAGGRGGERRSVKKWLIESSRAIGIARGLGDKGRIICEARCSPPRGATCRRGASARTFSYAFVARSRWTQAASRELQLCTSRRHGKNLVDLTTSYWESSNCHSPPCRRVATPSRYRICNRRTCSKMRNRALALRANVYEEIYRNGALVTSSKLVNIFF